MDEVKFCFPDHMVGSKLFIYLFIYVFIYKRYLCRLAQFNAMEASCGLETLKMGYGVLVVLLYKFDTFPFCFSFLPENTPSPTCKTPHPSSKYRMNFLPDTQKHSCQEDEEARRRL